MARVVSKEKIINYLQEQPWYSKFINNLDPIYRDNISNLLEGTFFSNDNLIMRSINWSYSPEGFRFWQNVNTDYKRWYFYTSHNLSKEKILEYLKSQSYYLKLKGTFYCYDREKRFEDFIGEHPDNFFGIISASQRHCYKKWLEEASESYSN